MNLDDRIRDVVIIGSGAAGLMFATHIAKHYAVDIFTKDVALESNTKYAQGGIAAVLRIEDTYQNHIRDTLKAGAGLCDEEAVKVLVHEAPARIYDLMNIGVNFDLSDDHNLEFTKEGGHSDRRILHVGDMTGQAIESALLKTVQVLHPKIMVHDHAFVLNLVVKDGVCFGVDVLTPHHRVRRIFAKTVFIATGGAGQLFSVTTNPEVATGDGYVMAYKAGARLQHLEFIQFHPTAFHKEGAPNFLISESVRGEGGILINKEGYRFMPDYHKDAELAPRDIVSRAIVAEMQKTNTQEVFLDLRHLGCDYIRNRFPTIVSTIGKYGINPCEVPIPVAPAAHYFCGGIRTDIDGRTSIQGLYAGGEVACTGVHGANRLASNSLLESVVFAYRAAVNADRYLRYLPDTWFHTLESLPETPPVKEKIHSADDKYVAILRKELQNTLWEYCSIVRTYAGMKKGMEIVRQLKKEYDRHNFKPENSFREAELYNLLTLAELVFQAAIARDTNVGTHYNADLERPTVGGSSREREV